MSNYVPVFHEVYDLNKDPWQMNNLYPGILRTQPGLVAELSQWLDAMNQCKGDTCRVNEMHRL